MGHTRYYHHLPTMLRLLICFVALLISDTNAFMMPSVAYRQPASGVARRTAASGITAGVKLVFPTKTVDVAPGSPMKSACAKAGFKPRYNCKKGDCSSCVVSVGGTRVKCCVGKVPPVPKLKSLQEKGLVVR